MNYIFPVWKSCDKTKPEIRKPILMKGDSGYIEPHGTLYISGYYDPEYRPRSPWLDSQSSCVSDCGLTPTHWCYIEDLEWLLTTDFSGM